MTRRHFYVERYADEFVPCDTTLEAWAVWLTAADDRPDDDWPEREVAKDGEIFEVYTIDELDEIEAVRLDGVWTLRREPPAEADSYVCRMGRIGWDAETWSETPLDYLNEFEADAGEGETEKVVCTRHGPSLICRLDLSPPALVILGNKQ